MSTFDVWRIINNDRVKNRFGVKLTGDLYKNGLLEMWVNPVTYEPSGNIRINSKLEKEKRECPFLDNGSCLLGEDRPTFCYAKPVFRMIRAIDSGMDICRACSKFSPGEIMSAPGYISKIGARERYNASDIFAGAIIKLTDLEIQKRGQRKRMMEAALTLLFNWHDFLESSGLDMDTIKSPSELIIGSYEMAKKIEEADMRNMERVHEGKGK